MTGGIGALHFTGDGRFMELRNVFFFYFFLFTSLSSFSYRLSSLNANFLITSFFLVPCPMVI